MTHLQGWPFRAKFVDPTKFHFKKKFVILGAFQTALACLFMFEQQIPAKISAPLKKIDWKFTKSSFSSLCHSGVDYEKMRQWSC